jgi:hypothetical protein
MNDRLQYIDRMEMSLSDAFGMIQSLQGGSILKATRIVTESAGFLPDSFTPVAIESSLEQRGVFYITFLAGPVIFPSGEVYIGNWFRTKLAIQKQIGYQYVLLRHMNLRRTAQHLAPGSGGSTEYAERLDGARLSLSSLPILSDDGMELLVARIRYEPGMQAPNVEDIRDIWRFFWTPSEIIDPNENLDAILQLEEFQFTGDFRADQPTTPLRAINNEESLFYVMHFDESTMAHAFNARAVLGNYAFHSWEPRPFKRDTKSLPIRETTGIYLPAGIEASFGVRKLDMYRSIATEWASEQTLIPGQVLDRPALSGGLLDCYKSPYHTMLGWKIYATDFSEPHSFIKVWMRDGSIDANTLTQPCDLEIPVVLNSVPFNILPGNPAVGEAFIASRLIDPDHTINPALATFSIPLVTRPSLPIRPLVLNLGGDLGKLFSDDYIPHLSGFDDAVGSGTGANWWTKGGRVWFDGDAHNSNTPPVHVFRTPGPSDGRTFTLTRAVFVNYQDSGYGAGIDVTGVLYVRKKGQASAAQQLLAVGSNDGSEFPATDIYDNDVDGLDIELEPDTQYELCMESDNPASWPHMQVRGYLTLYLEEVLP